MNTGPITPMQNIDQLRRDTRPLTQLGTVCEVTGEQLGSLLTRLKAKNTPLFVERPHEAHLYCVPQKEVGEHQEIIVISTSKLMPSVPRITKNEIAPVEANHFRYLVLSPQDYSHLLDGDVALSVKLFSQAAFRESDVTELSLVDASQYIKERLPNAHFHQRIRAKFACYFEERPNNEARPDTLKMKSLQANAEDLLVSRKALLSLPDPEKKSNDEEYPDELKEHLQPWKSDYLCALNKAAYVLYSNMSRYETRNSVIKPKDIQETIKKQLPESSQPATKISTTAPLLRHDIDQKNAKKYLTEKNINQYPYYFTYSLMYMNEKCKEYHDAYLVRKDIHPLYIREIVKELHDEKAIPNNTVERIANAVRPNYQEINRPEK